MKKLLPIVLILFSASVYAQRPRFLVSEPFTTPEEAVNYANRLPNRLTAQFVLEFDARSPSPAVYRVVSDRDSSYFFDFGSGTWYFQEGLDLPKAVDSANGAASYFDSLGANVLAQFVGYWNPNLNPHSTTTTLFFIPAVTRERCEYELIDFDFGPPGEAAKYAQERLEDKSHVEFSMQFNVGSSVFGSMWLVALECTRTVPSAHQWQLVENDEEGNVFDLESAVRYAERNNFRFVRFVSFVSPSEHDSRSRVVIFYMN